MKKYLNNITGMKILFGEDIESVELKVGDRVKILNNDYHGRVVIGSIGTIVGITRGGRYNVQGKTTDHDDSRWWIYRKEDLEKV